MSTERIDVLKRYESFKVTEQIMSEDNFIIVHALPDLGSSFRQMRNAICDLWNFERDIFNRGNKGWLAAVAAENKKMRRWLSVIGAVCYRFQGRRMLFMKVLSKRPDDNQLSLKDLARRIRYG